MKKQRVFIGKPITLKRAERFTVQNTQLLHWSEKASCFYCGNVYNQQTFRTRHNFREIYSIYNKNTWFFTDREKRTCFYRGTWKYVKNHVPFHYSGRIPGIPPRKQWTLWKNAFSANPLLFLRSRNRDWDPKNWKKEAANRFTIKTRCFLQFCVLASWFKVFFRFTVRNTTILIEGAKNLVFLSWNLKIIKSRGREVIRAFDGEKVDCGLPALWLN